MIRRFRMESNDISTRFKEISDHAIYRLNHQMYINGRLNPIIFQGLANTRTKSQVRHIMVIHDIKMDNVCTCFQHVLDFFT